MGEGVSALVTGGFVALLAWAVWGDIRRYRIPNLLVVLFLVLFAAAAAVGMIEPERLWGHAGAGATALLAGLALFHRGWIGGGDAKLFAALALWTGWSDFPRLILVTALAGGGVAAWTWFRHRRASIGRGSGELKAPGIPVPYGVAIALAGLDFWLRQLAGIL
jgi:prepilin peptidase CpaA